MKGAFTTEFTPVGRYGDVLLLDDDDEQQHFRIEATTPMPELETEEIVVDGESRSDKMQFDVLETWDGWLGQYRLKDIVEELPDDVSFTLNQGGRQAPLYINKNQQSEIDNESFLAFGSRENGSDTYDYRHELTELFVFGDEVPYFEFINRSGDEETFSLSFTGFLFNITPISEADVDRQPVHVPIESIRGN